MKTSLNKRSSEADIYLAEKRLHSESEGIHVSHSIKILKGELADAKRQIQKLRLENFVLRDSLAKCAGDVSATTRLARVEEEMKRTVPEVLAKMSPAAFSFDPSETEAPPSLVLPSAGTTHQSSLSPPPASSHVRPKRNKRAVILADMMVHADYLPVFPIQVGVLTVLSLGTVCMDEGYHTERYIYPIGYKITRQFQSAINKNQITVYTCSIERGESGKGPLFQVVAEDNPGVFVHGNSPTQCWARIARAVNILRERTQGGSVNGPDYFGLTQGLIVYWLQKLPGVSALKRYEVQDIQLVDQRLHGPGAPERKRVKKP